MISDSIKYFYFLKKDIFEREFKKCPLVYVSLGDKDYVSLNGRCPNFRRLLELLDIDPDKIQLITQPTQFDKIILPDESFYLESGVRKFTSEYREMIDLLKNFAIKNRTPTSSKKIYYFHGRRQIGEERLAEYFKSKGYEIVSPEKLTLDEQLNILINCESFASSVGSCAHNSVFLREGSEAILIPRIAKDFNTYQLALNSVNSIDAIYLDSTLSLFNGSGRYFIISEQLKKFFGDKFDGYEEEDFKNFLQYVSVSKSNAFTVREDVTSYYNEVFKNFLEQLKHHNDLATGYYMPTDLNEWRPLLRYQTHVHVKGWNDGLKEEDQPSNPLDQKYNIQAIKINLTYYKVYYSVYYNDEEGWSDEVTAPETAGTTGKNKSIFGIRVRLDETGSKAFDILYRLHKFDDTWTPWAKNGEALYSYGVKLNAIQMKLEPKT